MQISKSFLAVCFLTASIGWLSAQTDMDESEARAQAIDQLNQKMAELEAQLQEGEMPKPPITAPGAETKTAEEKKTTEEVVPKPAEEVVAKPAEEATPKPSEEMVKPKPVEEVIAKPVPVPSPTPVPRAIVGLPPAGRLSDAELMAKAREQTRAKIAELNRQSIRTTVVAKSTAAPPKPTLAPATKPEVRTELATLTPKEQVTVKPERRLLAPARQADDELTARMRQQTRRKIVELEAQGRRGVPTASRTVAAAPKPTATAPKPPTPSPKPLLPTAAKTEIKPTAEKTTPSPQAEWTGQPAQPKGRKKAEEEAMKVAAERREFQTPTAATLAQAPPPAVSAGKQQRLAELLARYKADKITPEEYHTERAKILAEP